MFKTEDRDQFVASHKTEIEGLQKFDVMDIEHISSLPQGARLLSSIWSYRRKRLPNGIFLKYKSRLCLNGREHAFGRGYWEMYAPVASWATIHMMLIMSSILNLKTRQVDYTQAFPQATLDDPVFMQIPQGWYVKEDNLYQHSNPKHNDTTHYMRLKRNLYGCKQAARNWFQHLTKGLLQLGFVQSRTDSCLFLRHDCILVVYVDDCLIFAEINTLSASYLLQDERDMNAFLGIKINNVQQRK